MHQQLPSVLRQLHCLNLCLQPKLLGFIWCIFGIWNLNLNEQTFSSKQLLSKLLVQSSIWNLFWIQYLHFGDFRPRLATLGTSSLLFSFEARLAYNRQLGGVWVCCLLACIDCCAVCNQGECVKRNMGFGLHTRPRKFYSVHGSLIQVSTRVVVGLYVVLMFNEVYCSFLEPNS